MENNSRFIVLVERRWLRKLPAIVALFATLVGSGAQTAAYARPLDAQPRKVARDLADALDESRPSKASWTRSVRGTRQVQAVVVSSSSDAQMTDLRNYVVGIGGVIQAVI